MSCFQLLKLNSNTGDLSIDQGNVVNFVQAIKLFSVKTPVLDFKLNGNYIELYYKDVDGNTVLKKVLLPTPPINTGISVQSTPSIASSIQNGIISSSVNISQVAGNKIVINSDGIYSSGVETPITANDSSTINFQQTDALGHILTATVNVSAFAGNGITVRNDGLYVSVTALTAAQIRSYFGGTAPIVFDSATGIISITKATTSVDGYVSSTDWNTFNNKITTATALGTGTNLFKQKNGVNLEFLAIKAGIGGISLVASGDDVLINSTNLPPTVSAGTNQTITNSPGTTNLNGAVVPNTGSTVSATWTFLAGPSIPAISDRGVVNPALSGLTSAGTYKFRLLGINSVGLSNTSDMSILVTSGGGGTDTIYYSAQSSATPPDATAIALGASFTQNGALDVPVDWTSFNATPLYCWVAIPDGVSAYIKHKWVVIAGVNEGNIAYTTDLFGIGTPPTPVPYVSQQTVGGVLYNVYFTNYQTQFTGVCTLKTV
jgi:hypothetical protein